MNIKKLLKSGYGWLEITAYKDRNHTKKLSSMKVQHNPHSLTLAYQALYQQKLFVNQSSNRTQYERVQPGDLILDIIFDCTVPVGFIDGVDDIGSQTDEFKRLCCDILPDTRQLPFLKVTWGELSFHDGGYFSGRMKSLSFNYQLFSRNGAPLRATASLVLLADEPTEFESSLQNASAVVTGDMTLTSMAYTSEGNNYLSVARLNDLDHLDDIRPGDLLWLKEVDNE